ncbi:hypothetical protein M23134_02826 [Microscilla marina ATCC 23134]|uniref:Uncharacterized protein n=2 Tax=Microscilla marina TaxID=1027 RepID=A1ZPS4_MICM2|nr:hypothetical protein M23134_02826 [Microscilla marina ATCC 23134]
MYFKLIKTINWKKIAKSYRKGMYENIENWYNFQIINEHMFFWNKSRQGENIQEFQFEHVDHDTLIAYVPENTIALHNFKEKIFAINLLSGNRYTFQVHDVEGKCIYQIPLDEVFPVGCKILTFFSVLDELFLAYKVRDDYSQVIVVKIGKDHSITFFQRYNTEAEKILVAGDGVVLPILLDGKPPIWLFHNYMTLDQSFINYPYPQHKVTMPFPSSPDNIPEFFEDYLSMDILGISNGDVLFSALEFTQSYYDNNNTVFDEDIFILSCFNSKGSVLFKETFSSILISEDKTIYIIRQSETSRTGKILLEESSPMRTGKQLELLVPTEDKNVLDNWKPRYIDTDKKIYVVNKQTNESIIYDKLGRNHISLSDKKLRKFKEFTSEVKLQPPKTWQINKKGEIFIPIWGSEGLDIVKLSHLLE